MILQTVPSAGIFDSLIQYGVLGIATLGLGWVCWKLLQRQLETEERLNKKLTALEDKLSVYVEDDIEKLKDLAENNRKSYLELRDLIVVKNSTK
jgi:hypothetical protein